MGISARTGNNRGFTLIELLIVILIIGILAAIAVPAFLGQRSKAKARTLEASARTVERELVILMNNYSRQAPMVFLNAASQQSCYQHEKAGLKSSCALLFPDLPQAGTYETVDEIIALYIQQVNQGIKVRSPFDSNALLTNDDTAASRKGHILLASSNNSAIDISAWNDSGVSLFSAKISSH